MLLTLTTTQAPAPSQAPATGLGYQGRLQAHPQREAIAYRYLEHRHSLLRQTLARLVEEDPPESEEPEQERPERGVSLSEERLGTVVAAREGCGAKRVLDLIAARASSCAR